MNDQDELARRIVKLLDESTEHIDRNQRDRLAVARQSALARYRAEPAMGWAPVWANGLSWLTERRVLGVRYLIPMGALVLGLAGVAYVNSNGASPDIADIDAGLLTDELPINAYLDKGFDSWLKRSPH
jgi:hypothetical protein